MTYVIMAGNNPCGYDVERCDNMDEVKAYLDLPHYGYIHVYIDGCCDRHHIVPSGLGRKYIPKRRD